MRELAFLFLRNILIELKQPKNNDAFFSLSGLCSIFRSEAGGQADRFAEGEEGLNYRNNAHWLDNGEPSNFVAYYDATSLYPSSGE